MSKRKYHAESLDQVEIGGIFKKINSDKVIVAVDVAKEDFFASVAGEDGVVVKTIKWQHPTQTLLFLEFLQALGDPSRVEIALEPSGSYGDSLRWQLCTRKYNVYRVSGKAVHDYREVFDGVPSSHDAKACALISDLHALGRSKKWTFPTDSQREFKARATQLNAYDKAYTQNVNRLHAVVCKHWPELAQIIDLRCATAQTLVHHYGGPQAVLQNSHKARDLMQTVGGHLLQKEKIDAVIDSAKATLGVPQLDAEREVVQNLAGQVLHYRQLKAKAEVKIRKLIKQTPPAKEMAHAIGKTTAAIIIGATGDPANYNSSAAFVKALGLNLRESSSGKHHGAHHITKRGSSLARKYLYLAVLRLIHRNPIVRAYYEKAVAARGGKQTMKVLIGIMRKLAASLYHVAQGNAFDASKLFDVRRLEPKAS